MDSMRLTGLFEANGVLERGHVSHLTPVTTLTLDAQTDYRPQALSASGTS